MHPVDHISFQPVAMERYGLTSLSIYFEKKNNCDCNSIKIFLYDGSTGDRVAEFTEGAHSGGVFAVSWSPDSKQLFTSSADSTCKIWDIETRRAVK